MGHMISYIPIYGLKQAPHDLIYPYIIMVKEEKKKIL